MSEFLYEESVFDDSSDLEESWAGENVTFDASPASRKFFMIVNFTKSFIT